MFNVLLYNRYNCFLCIFYFTIGDNIYTNIYIYNIKSLIKIKLFLYDCDSNEGKVAPNEQ